jgi:uncharacterized protein
LKSQPDGIGTDKGRPDGRPADYYVVMVARGPAWDPSRRRREQAGWDEHAAFMDALAEEGFVVLGGPLGEVDGENVLLVVDAASEGALRARLAADPWAGTILTIASVKPWSVWLRAPLRQ